MIKECPILLNNEVVTVVRYDKKDIQFPAIKKDAKTVFVKDDGGRYTIVDKPEAKEPVYRKAQKNEIIENVIPAESQDEDGRNESDAG